MHHSQLTTVDVQPDAVPAAQRRQRRWSRPRQLRLHGGVGRAVILAQVQAALQMLEAVSYTHLRAHETEADL
eukprot:1407192-Rhodomonas_salina.1